MALIQRTLRGYQVRRKVEYEVLNARADELWKYWEKIDVVAKGHFQRRVRRAWLAHKARQEEKRRKAEEAKKKQQGRYRRTTGRAPAPQFGRPTIAQPPATRKTEQPALSPNNAVLEVQKSKSAVVDGKPNPDINASTDLMAHTLEYVQQSGLQPMPEEDEKSEDAARSHADGSKSQAEGEKTLDEAQKDSQGTTSRNILETGDERDQITQRSILESSTSNVHPTPREADLNNPNNEAAASSMMSSTLEAPRNLESLAGVDGKDVARTVKEANKDENGQIMEEKEEDTHSREDIQKTKDDDSDDIARATD